nr:MAG TPA: hypothetical protein [Caudoviricetes sp.]
MTTSYSIAMCDRTKWHTYPNLSQWLRGRK